MKVVELDKLKKFFLSLPNYTLSVVDILKLINNHVPVIDCDLVEKDDVIRLIENYYFAPFTSLGFYEERKLLLDNIVLAIKCMKAGDKHGS